MLATIAFTLATLASGTPPRENACMTIDQARVTLAMENLITFQKAVQEVRTFRSGELISAKLCRADHRIMYVLTLLTPESRVIRIAVDAHSGAIQELH